MKSRGSLYLFSGAMRVLIVENSDKMIEIIRDRLGAHAGIEICGFACEPGDAIRQILGKKPDLVILDILLDNGNGLQVLSELERSDRRPEVVVLTNYAYRAYEQVCRERGVAHFYDKSFEFEKAMEAVYDRAASMNRA